MGKLSDLHQPVKAIIAADSGLGKSGSLWSLAADGFKLKIFDSDRGTPILKSILKSANALHALDNIEVNSFTDTLVLDPATGVTKPKAGKASAWPDMMKATQKWPDGGGIYEWGPDTVVVFDSLTLFGRAAMRHAQTIEGRNAWKPELQHYGTAMAQIEALFAMLYDEDVKCHVLYLTHVKEEWTRPPKGSNDPPEFIGAYPSSLGKALNDVIPRYVNDILTIKLSGSGPNAKRYLSTKPTQNQMATKTSDLGVKDEYLLATGRTPERGLAEYFADCGWHGTKVKK